MSAALRISHQASEAPILLQRISTSGNSAACDDEEATRISHEELPTQVKHVGGVRFALLILALCLSVFVLSLDNTILSTAIPKITDHFHSLEDVGWYGSAYLLSTSCTQLFYGKIYTLLPVKWVYVAAIALFEVGSLLCGIAPSSKILIIGRAVAGLGCAGVFTGTLVIITHTVPLEKRPVYSGLIGGVYGVASVAGPLLGGVFTDKLNWRWCFFINLPIVMHFDPLRLSYPNIGACRAASPFAVVIFLFQMPDSGRTGAKSTTRPTGWKDFDILGTLVFVPGPCQSCSSRYSGAAPNTPGSRRASSHSSSSLVCSFSVFVGVQLWKGDRATIPPRVFRQRSIWSAGLYGFSMSAAFFILTFYLPIWFQSITWCICRAFGNQQYTNGSRPRLWERSRRSAHPQSWVLLSIHDHILRRRLHWIGLISTLKVNSNHTKWIPFEIIAGLGVGVGLQQPQLAAQTVLELKDVPVGTAIAIWTQTIGAAIFVSIAQNVFTNKLKSGLGTIPGVDPNAVLGAGATSLQSVIPAELLGRILIVYNKAIVSTFYVGIGLACFSLVGSLVIEWRSIKGKHLEMGMVA
ncbi:major facilitator superfamily domain-containing protein [Roridomyces roridus]|uniref:Major facilitator superfamily domain-containing protein n=1 Tax=Roridomyces roridus TaxID=1738132 RepID=A0AAD7BD36_9AGAR|nr:major facilitator superfamily domain-containing protein [Roridomyces roridus]